MDTPMVDLESLLADLNTRLISAGRVPFGQDTPRPAEAVEMMRVVIFVLGETRYAVDIRYVNEIARRADFTPVPGVPGWVLGVMNLHGEIVSVVDLAAFLKVSLPRSPRVPDMLVVAQAGDQKIGFMVDRVDLIYSFPADQVRSLSLRSELGLVPFLRGAIERDGDLIRLLDGERLLLGPHMQQFA
jgi:purine-binding chemotaxis protein CheW